MPHLLSPRASTQHLFQGISYEQVKPGKPPLPILSAPRPSSAQANLHPSLRHSQHPALQSSSQVSLHTLTFSDNKRDSGYTNSLHYETDSNGCSKSQSLRSSQSFKKSQSLRKSQSLPRFSTTIKQSSSLKRLRKLSEHDFSMESPKDEAPKLPELQLPQEDSSNFDDLSNMEFSKRGSMYIRGQRPAELTPPPELPLPRRVVSAASTRGPPRILSTDEESLSQRVRSMYETGTDNPSQTALHRLSFVVAEPAIQEEPTTPSGSHLIPEDTTDQASTVSKRASLIREDQELAGGIEDWQDVQNEDVDRYGFIIPKPLPSASSDSLLVPKAGIHRVATSLQLAAESPRRSRSKLARSSSQSKSMRSLRSAKEVDSTGRPISSQSAYSTTRSISVMRSATNRLPHNRDRRLVDEAGDMLTLPPTSTTVDNVVTPKAAAAAKRKEWSREEKWRKMAKVTRPRGIGGPSEYGFDSKDPKVISRTWKGIPDRWRATAWHSFLSQSAKRYADSQTDAELIASFHELVDQGSPDDVQIDLDVPRTISSHIMFRRRYRGGQRLLFRVLHALSLYFPETGYVQGMAALAATFLCYFDEEMAFVMLVRLWQTRGLDRLYQDGFAGLMDALNEFESGWLAGGDINSKLTELGITPTAYGTRWYLTIFNYTIPFPAQLRVWDVYLLLGEPDNISTLEKAPLSAKHDPSFHGGLDVLHATSAALIDGMREILLDSDFENAMKALTSWVPIQDEDLLMRVTRAEWKVHRRKR